MDDPLIGLSIYDNTRAQSVGASATSSTIRKQSKRFLKKGGVDDASEECFPCLPGISEDQHTEIVKPPPEPQQLISSHSIKDPESMAFQSVAPKEELESQQQHKQLSLPNNYWLMRLFDSSLFTMSIGIGYLFKSKDRDVLSYLGGKLFVSCVSLLYFLSTFEE